MNLLDEPLLLDLSRGGGGSTTSAAKQPQEQQRSLGPAQGASSAPPRLISALIKSKEGGQQQTHQEARARAKRGTRSVSKESLVSESAWDEYSDVDDELYGEGGESSCWESHTQSSAMEQASSLIEGAAAAGGGASSSASGSAAEAGRSPQKAKGSVGFSRQSSFNMGASSLSMGGLDPIGEAPGKADGSTGSAGVVRSRSTSGSVAFGSAVPRRPDEELGWSPPGHQHHIVLRQCWDRSRAMLRQSAAEAFASGPRTK